MALDIEQVLARAFFLMLRIGGLMSFAPFLGSLSVPPQVKAALTVALTALLYPTCAPWKVQPGAWNLVQLAGAEAALGLLLGLVLHFVFDGARLAGELLGFQLGFSLANVIDPQSQVDTPVLSIFHQVVALLIFLQLDVHHWMLRGLARSFTYLPAGAATATPAATAELLRLAGGIWLVAVQIAAPALLATMLADVALGFLGKAAPQLPVLFVGLSVKSVLGYAVLFGAVAFWPVVLEEFFREAVVSAERLLHLAR